MGGELERERAAGEEPRSEAGRSTRAECKQPRENELAAISCDGEEIVVKYPIRAYANERAAGDPTPRVLAAVAELLRRHPEILLVRIEVRSLLPPPRDPSARRHELLQTQARADTVLRTLFRRHGISAERLEAVGHGASGPIAAAGPRARWVVSFLIAQRARDRAGAQK